MHTQDQYAQKALNLYVPDLQDTGIIDRRIDFLLGAGKTGAPKRAFANLDAKSFYEEAGAAFGLKVDQNGKILGKK